MGRTLVLGNKNYSSWSLRPWLALKKAGIPFDEVIVFLDRPDTRENILKYSPAGRVPVLIEDGRSIWDSLAICEWAAEKVPGLWPKDPAARAQARSVSAEMHSSFPALRAQMPMNIRATRQVPMTDALRADIDRVVEIWTRCREEFGQAGPWLFGTFSIADAMFAPVVTRLHTYQVDLPDVAAAYVDALYADPTFQEWQSDAENEDDILRIEEVGA